MNTHLNSNFNLKQTLVDELQVLVGKHRSVSTTTTKKGGIVKRKSKKELTIEEEFLILQQLAEIDVS